MPSELGLHTFISPFFSFSSNEFHVGGRKINEKKKKNIFILKARTITCMACTVGNVSLLLSVFFYYQHTRNKVKKEIFCLSSGCSQSPTDMRGKCIRITWAMRAEFPFSSSSLSSPARIWSNIFFLGDVPVENFILNF